MHLLIPYVRLSLLDRAARVIWAIIAAILGVGNLELVLKINMFIYKPTSRSLLFLGCLLFEVVFPSKAPVKSQLFLFSGNNHSNCFILEDFCDLADLQITYSSPCVQLVIPWSPQQ